jgi:pimeloyl-ACP methyl ester carboxylesterase
MPDFASYDGTVLAYHVAGTGPTVICFPGGPAQDSAYLGDLGGLTGVATVVRLDSRGSGGSAIPADPGTYRLDRLVDDVEALRVHLGLDAITLLGHSAGSNVAALYAAAYPDRVERLILLCGLLRVAGQIPIGIDRAYEARSGEPWYPAAMAAASAWSALPVDATEQEVAPLRAAMDPLRYGRWDAAARAHVAAMAQRTAPAARDAFGTGYPMDPEGVAARLGELAAPVLVVAGELDPSPTPEAAGATARLFRRATAVTIPAGGHYPWLENPQALVTAVDAFLREPPGAAGANPVPPER